MLPSYSLLFNTHTIITTKINKMSSRILVATMIQLGSGGGRSRHVSSSSQFTTIAKVGTILQCRDHNLEHPRAFRFSHVNSGNKIAKPNTRSYSILIKSWSKSEREEASAQGKNILEQMIRLHSNGELKDRLSKFAYNSAMDAYANKGDVQGASDVTKTMKDDFNSGKVTRMRSQTLGATVLSSKHGQNRKRRGINPS